jgi:hypothetical protein
MRQQVQGPHHQIVRELTLEKSELASTMATSEAAHEEKLREVFRTHSHDAGAGRTMNAADLGAALEAMGAHVKGGKVGLLNFETACCSP